MMNPVRKRKLIMVLFIITVVALAALLVGYALRQNISLFYSPTQIADGEALYGRVIRVGGMVVPGSLHRGAHDLTVRFGITDTKNTVSIQYNGLLPDLFREGKGVVAQGTFNPTTRQFTAVEILAKHDENYMPPEVKSAISRAKGKDFARL